MLKEELDNNRPIVYAGGAHVWVIDGYNQDDHFHCNWGIFDGDYDEYYSLGNFNPNGEDYNGDEAAIFDLYPSTPVLNNVIGSDVLTNQGTRYDIENIADCKNATWNLSPNIQAVYGGDYWIAVKAIGNGIGWLDATYILDGQIRNAPRKYVTCTP
jgi:hypothetical protein